MAAMVTGTSFSDTLAVTTGAGRPSLPRPPRPRPPPPGPAADVLLLHADAARSAPASVRIARPYRDRERMQRRLSTLDSKVQLDTGPKWGPFTRQTSFDVSLRKNYGFLTDRRQDGQEK